MTPQIGHMVSEATREKLRICNLGKKYSPETCKRISIAKMGYPAWNKGLETPEEVRKKQRDAKLNNPTRYWLGKTRPDNTERMLGKPQPENALLKRTISRYGSSWWYGAVIYQDPKYCERFNSEFKERVRAYWGYQCFECGTPQNGKTLCVHHVHYDKKMCCNGSPQDVVPLCQSCHIKSNKNRDYWEEHFTELLYAYSPDGKCFFTKDEMESYLGGI